MTESIFQAFALTFLSLYTAREVFHRQGNCSVLFPRWICQVQTQQHCPHRGCIYNIFQDKRLFCQILIVSYLFVYNITRKIDTWNSWKIQLGGHLDCWGNISSVVIGCFYSSFARKLKKLSCFQLCGCTNSAKKCTKAQQQRMNILLLRMLEKCFGGKCRSARKIPPCGKPA